MRLRLLAAVVLLVGIGRVGAAQAAAGVPSEAYIRSHYSKTEYRIPMRDGVKLFTTVYVPQSGAFIADRRDPGPYPFLMTRTPYSCAPYGEDQMPVRLGVSEELLESGYIFVCQDVRGRWESEGVFREMSPHIENKTANQVDESTDTYDTVEFLLKHVENNNGNVGITGISYPGFTPRRASSIRTLPSRPRARARR
jgi:putative CocE/NonD family hydrolase